MKIRYGGASLLVITSGLIVWVACFGILYGGLALGCTYGIPPFTLAGVPGITWTLALLWLLHLVLLGCMLVLSLRSYRRAAGAGHSERFAARSTVILTIVGFVGTVVIGAPVLMLPPCT